mgnify:CR=1 FL=1
MSVAFEKFFDISVKAVFSLILLALAGVILVGAFKLFFQLWETVNRDGITGQHLSFITDVLTLFVLIELSRSLVEYFKVQRLRMTFIVDAAIVFIIREVMILMFQHKAEPQELLALSVFLGVLTVLRIASIVMFQRERGMVETVEKEGESKSL